MFSAADYLYARYMQKYEQQLQELVKTSGLGEDDVLVKALLDAICPPDNFDESYFRNVADALAWSAAFLDSYGGFWKDRFDAYVRAVGEDDEFSIAAFYKEGMGNILPLAHAPGQRFGTANPLVLVRQPAVKLCTGQGGRLGDYMYHDIDTVEIGRGRFEVVAGLEAHEEYEGELTLGILQFASCKRVATYDGVTVRKDFEGALDSRRRPWMDEPAQVVAGEKAVVAARDAPIWRLPKQWKNGQELLSITIEDHYTTHVALQSDPKHFTTRFSWEWAFHATYDAESGVAAAKAKYQIGKREMASIEIELTGEEPLANDYQARVEQGLLTE